MHGFPRRPGIAVALVLLSLGRLPCQLHDARFGRGAVRSGAHLVLLFGRHAHLLPYLSYLLLQFDGLVFSAGRVVRHGQIVH